MRRRNKRTPKNWSSSSVAPYYTKKHGDFLRPYLIELSKDPIAVASFDCRKMNTSLNALYFRIYHGWLWLIENDDPEGFFKVLKEKTRLCKGRVTVTIKHGSHYNAMPIVGSIIRTATEEDEGEEVPIGWRTQLAEYVAREGEEHLPLEVTGIPLIEEDLDWIAQFMAPFRETVVLVKLTTTSFKVCKSKKLVEMLKAKKAAQAQEQNDSRQTPSSES